MPSTEFDVLFCAKPGSVLLSFTDPAQALAYERKSVGCTIGNDPHEVTLPRVEGLKFIRASDSTHELVFVFINEHAADIWSERLALVIQDGREVRIKRTWGKGQLDKALGLDGSKKVHAEKRRGKDHDIGKAQNSRRDERDD